MLGLHHDIRRAEPEHRPTPWEEEVHATDGKWCQGRPGVVARIELYEYMKIYSHALPCLCDYCSN